MNAMKSIQAVFAVMVFILSLPTCAAASGVRLDADSSAAAILAYHRIDEDTYPGNSLRLEGFAAHLREIEHGGYNVMALPDIIKAMKAGDPLPDRTIAITFEGGYQSAYQRAIPLLLKARIPFTVFYSSYNAERDSGEYIGWRDIKTLSRYDFVSFGILPAAYSHIKNHSLAENKRFVNNARLEYRKHMGHDPALFSYPFGEFTADYKDWIKRQGFSAAFGLQSGIAHKDMDFYNIPRFVMTEGFGDIERFRMITGALPIPAFDTEPADHFIRTATPLFGFSVPEKLGFILNSTQCFISGQGEAETVKIGSNRLEIRPSAPLSDDKIRLNCTANTGNANEPQWRWFGMMYTIDTDSADNNIPIPADQDGLDMPEQNAADLQ